LGDVQAGRSSQFYLMKCTIIGQSKGIPPKSDNVKKDMLALTCKGKIVTGKFQRFIAHDAKINFNYDP
jgi:hypothetical protein